MKNIYNILVTGSTKSGKTTLIKSLINYFENHKIYIPFKLQKIFIKELKKVNLRHYDLLFFVIDIHDINDKKKLDIILELLNFITFLIKIEKFYEHDLKLLLIINKDDKRINSKIYNLFKNYKMFRCSSIKILLENIIANKNKMDIHKFRCMLYKNLNNNEMIDCEDYNKKSIKIYGDCDNLIEYILEHFLDKRILSKL